MARPKSRIRKALSDAHLKAIGSVAANWSDLEFCLMVLIKQSAEAPTMKVFAMIAGGGLVNWLNILHRLAIINNQKWKWDEFKRLKLEATLRELHSHRNNIVHASWDTPDANQNKLLQLLSPTTTPPLRAEGMGFKKQGVDITIGISYTAPEMRAIAKRIEEATQALLDWSRTPSPEQKRQFLAQALREHPKKGRTPAKQKTPKR